MGRFFILAVTGSVLLGGMSADATAQFNHMRLDSTVGRVGFHMSIGMPLTNKNDLPRGNTGGAVSGSCGQWTTVNGYQGELPPGVTFNTGNYDTLFSGTPRQPGTWRGTLSLSVRCEGGPDRNSYQRTIPVTWQIDP